MVGEPNTVVIEEVRQIVTVLDEHEVVVVQQPVTSVVEVSGGFAPNPILVFKTADETNLTTSFTNDDELHFEVEEGSTYVGRLTLIATGDNDDLTIEAQFDVPTDVVLLRRRPSNAYLSEGDFSAAGLDSDSIVFDIPFTIDATLNGGTVTFQFRNPDGNTSGGVTVKAGSFIELFKVT